MIFIPTSLLSKLTGGGVAVHSGTGGKRSFIAALCLLLIVLLLFGSLMYFAEHNAQPDKFATIPESLYWAAIPLTTWATAMGRP